MARRRRSTRRGPTRRSRATQRNTVRSINRAVHFKPVRSRVNQDPPPILRTTTGSVIIPILLSVKPPGDTSSTWAPGSVDTYSYLQLGRSESKIVTAASLTAQMVTQALYSWMSWDASDAATLAYETSWAVRKVSLWGPNPYQGSPHYRDAEIGLRVDLGEISNALEVNDCGTTTRRPCVAISLPFSLWMISEDNPIITILPDAGKQPCDIAEGAIWGRLHVSLDWRRTPSTILLGEKIETRAGSSTTTSTEPTFIGNAHNKRGRHGHTNEATSQRR